MTPSHTCREIINIENLTKMLKANKVDPDCLTSLKKLKQQLKKWAMFCHAIFGV